MLTKRQAFEIRYEHQQTPLEQKPTYSKIRQIDQKEEGGKTQVNDESEKVSAAPDDSEL